MATARPQRPGNVILPTRQDSHGGGRSSERNNARRNTRHSRDRNVSSHVNIRSSQYDRRRNDRSSNAGGRVERRINDGYPRRQTSSTETGSARDYNDESRSGWGRREERMSLTGAGGGSTNDEARSEERTQIRTRETVTGSVGDDNNEGGAAPSRPAEDSNVNNDYLARNDVADRQERNHDQPNEMMQRAVAEPNICVICQDDMSNQQRIMRVECGVSFHEECILTWLRTNHSVTCPCCRRTHWAGNQNNETCSICLAVRFQRDI